MHARPGSGRNLAGDAVQARETAAALRRLGLEVDLAEGETLPEPARYDLVHLFNLMPVEPAHAAFRLARARGRPVVLTPVFWDPTEFLDRWERGPEFRDWWRKTDPLRREILAGTHLLLPNAEAELACLGRIYGPLPPHRVVPNGVNEDLFRPGGRGARAAPAHVLCVARLSPRKNQLGLLEALRPTGLPVRFIGPLNDLDYYRACRRISWPGVVFEEALTGARLAAAYAAAPVHALASWYETPGLASLEAAACGCRVVSTDRGSAREYLGGDAWYCRPDEADTIREAVLAALAAPVPAGLAARVRARYNWGRAARETLRAYELVLGGRT